MSKRETECKSDGERVGEQARRRREKERESEWVKDSVSERVEAKEAGE